MVFSGIPFLFLFLPLALLFFYLSPSRFKNLTLLLFSLLFYTWGEGMMVALLLFSTLVDFTCGIIIDKGYRKFGLYTSVITNLSLLGFFKYFNFTFDNIQALFEYLNLNTSFFESLPYIMLPIGISFYTFQTLSYTIDVYRGHVKANYNFVDFCAFVTMFPQLVAGPIVRYADIDDQLKNPLRSWNHFNQGIERFIIGLAKKALLANTFAWIADTIFHQSLQDLSTPYAWLGIIAYSFQIYFDFSAYSDMAIGLGKMFGFDFLENFNYPYIAQSIQDFWRRWHISLSTWFRDYLYIPLGGNRLGKYRTYINLVIVFFITGLWHGASWNFIVWGLFHGLFIVLERLGGNKFLDRLWKPLKHFYTLLVVLTAWVFFRADNLSDALTYLHKMFIYQPGNQALMSYIAFFTQNIQTFLFMILGIICSTPIFNPLENWWNKKPWGDAFKFVFYLTLLSLSLIYLIPDSYNPFIYFRF